MKTWLKSCGYPDDIIEKGFATASLQGPAPLKDSKVIPLISTYYSNYSNELLCTAAKQLIKGSKDDRVKQAFENVQFVQALKQPPNLLRTLTNSKFINGDTVSKVGVSKCSDKRCKICRLYVQTGTEIPLSNGQTWRIKMDANCNSKNILYFLVCYFCQHETYIGKTDQTRDRTNNHITGCRYGNGSNVFDLHVYKCGNLENLSIIERKQLEPYFKLYIMMACKDYQKLLDYEKRLHMRNCDTMNSSIMLCEKDEK